MECLNSIIGVTECIHFMACGHGMYTFYTLFYRMYTFYISIGRMWTFYDTFNNLTQLFCTKEFQQVGHDVEDIGNRMMLESNLQHLFENM